MASSDKEKAIKMKIAYNSRQYDLALQTLAEAVEEQHINQYVKDAVIKRFEYTYEMAWKLLKVILQYKGVSLIYPKEIFREAFRAGWIKIPEVWEDMIEDRNIPSHTYKARTAEDVYKNVCTLYYKEFTALQEVLKQVIEDDKIDS